MEDLRRLFFAAALTIAAVALAQSSLLPPGFRATTAGARFSLNEFSIAAPGKGWIVGEKPEGVVLIKRVDATESYHAGLKTMKGEALADQAAFREFARRIVGQQSAGNPRYTIRRHQAVDYSLSGYWAVKDTVTFEDRGAINVGSHGALLTHGASLFITNPAQPADLIVAWFSWRGVNKPAPAFDAEADRFFAMVQHPAK